LSKASVSESFGDIQRSLHLRTSIIFPPLHG
jgi:hypothetical protein